LSDAHSTLTRTVIAKTRAFESSSDFVAAQAKLAAAQKEYRNAADRVLVIAADRPDYIAAMHSRREAEARLELLRSSHSANATEMSRVANEVMTASAAAHEVEAQALASDQKVQAAKQQMQSARDDVARLRSKFTASLVNDSEWRNSREAMVNASQKLVSAERAFASP